MDADVWAWFKAAHVANRIPPWTIAGDELFVVIATWRPISPGAVTAVAEQMICILNHLGTSGHGTGAGSAAAPVTTSEQRELT